MKYLSFGPLAITFTLLGTAPLIYAQTLPVQPNLPAQPAKKQVYVKRQIVESRYGDADRQIWVQKAYAVKKNLDAKIFGCRGSVEMSR